MPTLNTTPNQGYQLPFAGNDLADDVARIIAAIGAIDTDVASALSTLAAKAGLASPAFTGTPTAPTASPGTDTGQLATTAFVKAALDALIGGAPGALDTLNELAEAIGDDADYAASMVAALAAKADDAATTAALAGKLERDGSNFADEAEKQQFRTALGVVPAGSVLSFAMSTAPTGWLKANGAVISRTTYADLFAAIGTTFGVGDGSTTFAIPDLRGMFLRGWDDGRGVDTSRVFGSQQTADVLIPYRRYNSAATVIGAQLGLTNTVSLGHTLWDQSGWIGSETRPINVALLSCIKF